MGSTLEYLQTEKRDEILNLASKHGLKNIRVFGSVGREEDGPDSDIDVLFSFGENGRIVDWFDFMGELEELLNRKVDVVPDESLHWYVKPQVLAEAKSL